MQTPIQNQSQPPSAPHAPGRAPGARSEKAATRGRSPHPDTSEEVRTIDFAAFNERLQVRVATDQGVVEQYAEAIDAGATFSRPVAFETPDGKLVLADGNHTVLAMEVRGRTSGPCRIRKGTRLDAIAYALSTNGAHGVRLTNADKRRAVGLLFGEPGAAAMSDGVIAAKCAVSEAFVAKIRKEQGRTTSIRVGRDGRTRDTGKIGAPATPHGGESTNKNPLPVEHPVRRLHELGLLPLPQYQEYVSWLTEAPDDPRLLRFDAGVECVLSKISPRTLTDELSSGLRKGISATLHSLTERASNTNAEPEFDADAALDALAERRRTDRTFAEVLKGFFHPQQMGTLDNTCAMPPALMRDYPELRPYSTIGEIRAALKSLSDPSRKARKSSEPKKFSLPIEPGVAQTVLVNGAKVSISIEPGGADGNGLRLHLSWLEAR